MVAPRIFDMFLTLKYLNASAAVLGMFEFDVRGGRVEGLLRGRNGNPSINAGTISMKVVRPINKVVPESWPSIYLIPS